MKITKEMWVQALNQAAARAVHLYYAAVQQKRLNEMLSSLQLKSTPQGVGAAPVDISAAEPVLLAIDEASRSET